MSEASPWRTRIVGHGEEDPEQLLANPGNWRIHPEAQQKALSGVLGQVGWVQSVIVNRTTGHLVDGHLRASLAMKDGAKSIPVSYVELTPEEENLVLATIDPLAAMAVTDGAKLAELLSGVSFDNAELEGILGDLAIDAAKALGKLDVDETDVPEAPENPQSKPGDTWVLGRHRLVVGDSTKPETWQQLMGDKRFDLLWTDPPYGIEYEGKTKEKLTIQNDGLAGLEDLLNGVFTLASQNGIPGAAVYVAHPDGPNSVQFQSAFLAQGWRWHQRLIWAKEKIVPGHSDYHQQHEAILFGYFRDAKGRRGRGADGWFGPNNESSLITHPSPRASHEHPTMKPIGLVARFIQNSAPIDGIVVDPFCGSGTTILAAEQTKRIGYGVELEPKYADVICTRFEKMTGITPVLESSGAAVSFVKE